MRAIERAALLHDLGKLAIPEAVLRKPAPLTLAEQGLVRQHPSIGAARVEGMSFLAPAAPLIRASQERLDGRGYPGGLRADAIPLGARIVAVADAYDTMIRPRVFRDAITGPEALREIERCRGTQFDPAVVEAFLLFLPPSFFVLPFDLAVAVPVRSNGFV